ncbi:hypothetical protein [Acerihabitans arboris]|uniref:Uncharacterized protein n=1 Tax=Acerihabitans arboris TaxID=2691583 RepID=A0A845SEN4_9GAMM|nr:hypothetical protein [Acerihabitans arboris]NDL63433.1 hypothetical protein [Acerihabitans arboris]
MPSIPSVSKTAGWRPSARVGPAASGNPPWPPEAGASTAPRITWHPAPRRPSAALRRRPRRAIVILCLRSAPGIVRRYHRWQRAEARG